MIWSKLWKIFATPREKRANYEYENKPTRLVLLLDGTNNDRKSETNIHKLENLIADPRDGWRQHKEYFKGVGVKWHEKARGGRIFGRYMSRQAKDAYKFLKDNYHEGNEVFIFGFSRGAFAAQILVGFCEWCGLIKPGADLSIDDLFKRYLDATRKDQEDKVEEAVSRRELLKMREGGMKLSAQSTKLLDGTIEVPIKFIGVFDTVRAAGLEALLPHRWRDAQQESDVSRWRPHHLVSATFCWLFGETLQENDIKSRGTLVCRYTRHLPEIVESAFQALAVDEHRASFAERVWIVPKNGYCPKRIEQRWFIGAHSNVGGGYKNNGLHLTPLRWMMANADRAGLRFKEGIDSEVEPRKELIRDSFSEFPYGIFKHFNKRRYRPIMATRVGTSDDKPTWGEERRVNETIDESVLRLASSGSKYAPCNLRKTLEALSKSDGEYRDLARKALDQYPH